MSDVREPVPEAEAAAELPLGLTACLGNPQRDRQVSTRFPHHTVLLGPSKL